MAIVFDNIVFNLQHAGGVSRFWSKVIQPYGGSEGVTFIEHSGGVENIYRKSMSITPVVPDHRLPIQMARYVNFSRNFFRDEFVFHSSYYRINSSPGSLNVTTVHDLIYEKFGKGIGTVLHLYQKAAALRKSVCIVCVSDNTRKDLLKYYPFCSDKQVVVIPNGVDGFSRSALNSEFGQADVGIDFPLFFLYVGHRGVLKGFNLVHDVIDMLDEEFQCVVVGDPFSKSEVAEIRERGHEKRIINVGKVSDIKLNHLYSRSSFFFFPSLYEGFGIPPLEAMSAGCPVLASNRSSVPEVVGDAGILFDPSDSSTLRSGLSRILQSEVRARLVTLGMKRASSFSWKSVVDRYAVLYSDLLREGSSIR